MYLFSRYRYTGTRTPFLRDAVEAVEAEDRRSPEPLDD